MTTAKNAVFIGLWLENCCLVGGIEFWWGWGMWDKKNFFGGGRGDFSRWVGGGMSKFSAGGEGF